MPPYRNLEKNSISLSHKELDSKILFFMMYFENIIVLPFNLAPGLVQTSSELEQNLTSKNFIARFYKEKIDLTGPAGLNFFSYLAKLCYGEINETKNQSYALGVSEDISAQYSSETINSLILVISECLPCPKPGIPINELINFRMQNSNELDLLYHTINKTMSHMVSGISREDGLEIAKKELNYAIQKVTYVYEKNKMPFFKAGLAIAKTIPNSVLKFGLDLFSSSLGLIPGSSVFLTDAISVKFGKSSLSRDGNSYPSDYEYVLFGIEKGYLSAFPNEEKFELDLEDIFISDCKLLLSYPSIVKIPGKVKRLNFSRNAMW